jgi:hypothetical protein
LMVEKLDWDVCDLCKRYIPVKKVYGLKVCTYCYGPTDLETRGYHRGWK